MFNIFKAVSNFVSRVIKAVTPKPTKPTPTKPTFTSSRKPTSSGTSVKTTSSGHSSSSGLGKSTGTASSSRSGKDADNKKTGRGGNKPKPLSITPVNSEVRIALSSSRLGQSVYRTLQHEGKPNYISNEQFLKQRFARTGWNREETRHVLNTLTMLDNQTTQPGIEFEDYHPANTYSSAQQVTILGQADEILQNSTDPAERIHAQAVILSLRYGVNLTINRTNDESASGIYWIDDIEDNPEFWNERINNAYAAVDTTAQALGQAIRSGRLDLPGYIDRNLSDAELFNFIMGAIEIRYTPNIEKEFAGRTEPNGDVIQFFKPIIDPSYIPSRNNIIHEFGHVLDERTGQYARRRLIDEPISSFNTVFRAGSAVLPENYVRNYAGFDDNFSFENEGEAAQEDWGDSFLAWVIGGFDENAIFGQHREAVVEGWLEDTLAIAYGRGNPQAVQDFIRASGYITQSSPLGPGSALRELPLAETQSPILSSQATHVVNVIGRINQPAEGNTYWYLVEYNGVVGFVREDSFKELPNVADIDANEVSLLTGRQYNTSTAATYQQEKRDAEGNIVRDNQGNPIMETVFNGYIWQRIRSN